MGFVDAGCSFTALSSSPRMALQKGVATTGLAGCRGADIREFAVQA